MSIKSHNVTYTNVITGQNDQNDFNEHVCKWKLANIGNPSNYGNLLFMEILLFMETCYFWEVPILETY